jgi:hypothetical protein
MKEQLISFETAKLAKEKGLDKIRCNYIYNIGYHDLQPEMDAFESFPKDSVSGQFHLALAPTQSLLQKWLREKHKIYIDVDSACYLEEGKYAAQIHAHGKRHFQKNILDGFTIFKTYEEALEEGLAEALRLIP